MQEEAIKVLDHGYVRFVEAWGRGDAGESEAGIIEAARQSTQGSFRGWDQDEKLLRFLFCNKPPHASPFEFAGMVIEVQAPVFCFREWQRHRSQVYEETVFADLFDDMAFNEMSARYSPLPDLNYVPTVERLMLNQGHKNKQAGTVKGSAELTQEAAIGFRLELEGHYQQQERFYQWALAAGVPKELARIHLPVGRYSRMRASTCLRNWLAFLTLRMDPGAQWEIRQFSNAVGSIIADQFPRTWSLFAEGRE